MKYFKYIIVFISIVLVIGIMIPVGFSLGYSSKEISSLCKDQSKFLIPRTLKIFTVYQRIELDDSRKVIATAYTLFNIPLQRIEYENINSCNHGSIDNIYY